ncbi:hypothetical protein NUSPORA_02025 [Nucleospora cyclopteri]
MKYLLVKIIYTTYNNNHDDFSKKQYVQNCEKKITNTNIVESEENKILLLKSKSNKSFPDNLISKTFPEKFLNKLISNYFRHNNSDCYKFNSIKHTNLKKQNLNTYNDDTKIQINTAGQILKRCFMNKGESHEIINHEIKSKNYSQELPANTTVLNYNKKHYYLNPQQSNYKSNTRFFKTIKKYCENQYVKKTDLKIKLNKISFQCLSLIKQQIALVHSILPDMPQIKSISIQIYLLLQLQLNLQQILSNFNQSKKVSVNTLSNSASQLKIDFLTPFNLYCNSKSFCSTNLDINMKNSHLIPKESIQNNANKIILTQRLDDKLRENYEKAKENQANRNLETCTNKNTSYQQKSMSSKSNIGNTTPNTSKAEKFAKTSETNINYCKNDNTKYDDKTSTLITKTPLQTFKAIEVVKPDKYREFIDLKYSDNQITRFKFYTYDYGSLSCRDNENDNSSDYEESTDEEEEEGYDFYFRNIQTDCKKLYAPNKYIKTNKSACKKNLLNYTYNFNNQNWMVLKESENDLRRLPEGFSFSPGWHRFRLIDKTMFMKKVKEFGLQMICYEYDLTKYFSIIFNLIRSNTYTKKNSNICFEICFQLICYHFCTKHKLGKGVKVTIDQKYPYIKYINNTNFKKLFKTEQYWRNKAEILYKKTKEQAFVRFKIRDSTFDKNHLYNFLLLIPTQNSKRVAFVSYVYHGKRNNEIDRNLTYVSEDQHYEIIQLRKCFFLINQEFQKYFVNAKQVLKNRFKMP